MQGAQKQNHEAYCTYVEWCGSQRNVADERFSTAPLIFINRQIGQPIGMTVVKPGNVSNRN